ncbi:hypothetical protein [Mycobacterium sp. NPDC004974]
MTTWKPVDTSPQAAPALPQPPEVTVADSGLRALNAANGLFLRAEHLGQMQAYAEEFALLAGVAAGPGVDYGYTVALDGPNLHVAPGLAIDGSRRPLRLVSDVTLKLDALPELGANEFWVVEVVAADPRAAGSEAVYGTLCSDPCGGATIRPWLDAAVTIRLSRDSLDGLAGAPASLKRNRLASRYFERERSGSDPWLTPTGGGRPVGGPLGRLWRAGAPESAAPSGPVRLAVLFQVGGKWVVDTWTARRDIGDGPARAVWENRLGLRPWNVFMAQVLQFEAQLVDTGAGLTVTGGSCEDKQRKLIHDFEGLLHQKGRQTRLADELKSLVEAQRDRLDEELREAALVSSFEELPPAGVLPRPSDQAPDQYFKSLFGTAVDLEVVEVRADCALRALEQAQHLDRIPVAAGTAPHPFVQLLVPVAARTDLTQLKPQGEYPWMVFVRACGPPKVDKVPVYLVDVEEFPGAGRGSRWSVVGKWVGEHTELLLSASKVATLSFPVDAWARPQTDTELGKLQAKVDESTDYRLMVLATTASGSNHRVALMSVRSGLLGVDLLPFDTWRENEVIVPAYDHTRLAEAIFIIRTPQIR